MRTAPAFWSRRRSESVSTADVREWGRGRLIGILATAVVVAVVLLVGLVYAVYLAIAGLGDDAAGLFALGVPTPHAHGVGDLPGLVSSWRPGLFQRIGLDLAHRLLVDGAGLGPVAIGPVGILRQADAVIGHGQPDDAGGEGLQSRFHEAFLAAFEGMFQRIGEKLGKEQPDARGPVDLYLDGVAIHIDADRAAPLQMTDRRGDAADIGAERHPLGARGRDARLGHFLIEKLQALDAAGKRRKALFARLGARLHADHADDHRQMVLHPVLDLAQHRVDRRVLALRRHILSIGALAHIALDAQEALQAVFAVIERCDHQTIEKFRSVGPIVENVDRDILLLAQRLADQPRMVRIGVVALKKPTIPPDRSGCGIAGDLLEGAVGVDDRIVGDVWIGQNQCQRQLGVRSLFMAAYDVFLRSRLDGSVEESTVGDVLRRKDGAQPALVHAHPTQNEALGEAHLALAGRPLHTHG